MDWTLDLCFTKDFACVTTPSRAGRRATLLSSLETEPAAMRAVKDIVLTRAEFSGLSRMQQMIKHSNLRVTVHPVTVTKRPTKLTNNCSRHTNRWTISRTRSNRMKNAIRIGTFVLASWTPCRSSRTPARL